jgi:hypothetical protein
MRFFIVSRGNLVTDPKWELTDTILGAIMGAIATFLGLMGVINNRFDKAYKRIENIEESGGRHAVNIATLTAHHQANTQFQDRVDRSLGNLEEQNSEQLKQNAEMLKLLGELKGTIQRRA